MQGCGREKRLKNLPLIFGGKLWHTSLGKSNSPGWVGRGGAHGVMGDDEDGALELLEGDGEGVERLPQRFDSDFGGLVKLCSAASHECSVCVLCVLCVCVLCVRGRGRGRASLSR